MEKHRSIGAREEDSLGYRQFLIRQVVARSVSDRSVSYLVMILVVDDEAVAADAVGHWLTPGAAAER